jgi:hypothetical protein
LEIDQKLSKKISVFINGGINYINILSAQYQSNAKGNYSGYYPDYYGLLIEEDGVYDFGKNKNVNESNNIKINNLSWSYQFGGGFTYSLNKKTSLVIGLNNRFNFTSLYEQTNDNISSNSNNLKSITNELKNVNLNLLNIDFGINIKL